MPRRRRPAKRKPPRKPKKPARRTPKKPRRHPRRPRPADQTAPGGPNRWEPRLPDIREACRKICDGWTIESVSRPYLRASASTVFKYLREFPQSELSQSIEVAIATAVGEDEEQLRKMAKKDFRALRLRLINRNPSAWRDRASLFEDPARDDPPPPPPPPPGAPNTGHEKVQLPAEFARAVAGVLKESIQRSQRTDGSSGS